MASSIGIHVAMCSSFIFLIGPLWELCSDQEVAIATINVMGCSQNHMQEVNLSLLCIS